MGRAGAGGAALALAAAALAIGAVPARGEWTRPATLARGGVTGAEVLALPGGGVLAAWIRHRRVEAAVHRRPGRFGKPVRLGRSGPRWLSPVTAAHPGGTAAVAWVAGARTVRVSVLPPGSGSFRSAVLRPPDRAVGAVRSIRLAAGRSSVLAAFSVAECSECPATLWTSWLTDSGRATPPALLSATGGQPGVFHALADLWVDAAGQAAAVWTEYAGGDEVPAYWAAARDGGPLLPARPLLTSAGPLIARRGDGSALALGDAGPEEVVLAEYAPGGEFSAGPPPQVAPGYTEAVALGPGGMAVVARAAGDGRRLEFHARPAGGTFASAFELPGAERIVLDSAGQGIALGDRNQIAAALMAPGAGAFASFAPLGQTRGQIESVAVSERGGTLVVWTTFSELQRFAALARPGTGFGPAAEVGDVGAGELAGAALGPDGHAVLAWHPEARPEGLQVSELPAR